MGLNTAMTNQKTYKIGYFTPTFGNKDNKKKLSEYFIELEAMALAPTEKILDHSYEIRDLKRQGDSLSGVFGKLRHNDIPKIAQPGNLSESDIPLTSDQGLLEKNHFIYYPNRELLLFQHSREASTTKLFEQYITKTSGHTTIFKPVLNTQSYKDIISGGLRLKELDIAISTPTGTILDASNNNGTLTKSILEILNYSDGKSLSLKVNIGRARKKSKYLSPDVYAAVKELFDLDSEAKVDIRRAKLSMLDDHDASHVVDLIADRIIGTVTVTMNGRYPSQFEIFQLMRKSAIDNTDELDRVLEEHHE
jgi:hypothetical protein